jgi:heparosan-N-sulfate-glucuronate 5-epimerase
LDRDSICLIPALILVAWLVNELFLSYDINDPVMAAHGGNNTIPLSYDEKGVPYYNYSTIGLQQNPLFIAEEVIFHADDYNVTNNETSKRIALNNADWLVANAVSHGNYSILYYDYPFHPKYQMEPPWRSAIAQAKSLEALTRAYEITTNQTYLDTAKSLLNSFFVEVKDGGVTLKTPRDGWWFETYADNNLVNTSKVLNGMLRSVLSIYQYYNYTGDPDARFLFDRGFIAIKHNLPLYDNNGWTYSDVYGTESSQRLHNANLKSMQQLLKIVNDNILMQYYDRWKDSEPP